MLVPCMALRMMLVSAITATTACKTEALTVYSLILSGGKGLPSAKRKRVNQERASASTL